MTDDEKKQAAAKAALDFVEVGDIVGVGTGSTTNHFIDALASIKGKVETTVSSSTASEQRLRALGIPVVSLNQVQEIAVYVDGADEATRHLHLIKGGGGALTREKIVAAVSRQFVCIVDDSKMVDVLGAYPLPIEVIPMARSWVARQLVALGGQPQWREGFTTDNGNDILDVHNLSIIDPVKMESDLNQIAGVVSNGLFARRNADTLLMATDNSVERLEPV